MSTPSTPFYVFPECWQLVVLHAFPALIEGTPFLKFRLRCKPPDRLSVPRYSSGLFFLESRVWSDRFYRFLPSRAPTSALDTSLLVKPLLTPLDALACAYFLPNPPTRSILSHRLLGLFACFPTFEDHNGSSSPNCSVYPGRTFPPFLSFYPILFVTARVFCTGTNVP